MYFPFSVLNQIFHLICIPTYISNNILVCGNLLIRVGFGLASLVLIDDGMKMLQNLLILEVMVQAMIMFLIRD